MTPSEEIATLTEQLAEAKADLVAAEAEIEDLKDEVKDLRDGLSNIDECTCSGLGENDGYISADTVAEFKHLVQQKQYDVAIDLIDRELPARLRYA